MCAGGRGRVGFRRRSGADRVTGGPVRWGRPGGPRPGGPRPVGRRPRHAGKRCPDGEHRTGNAGWRAPGVTIGVRGPAPVGGRVCAAAPARGSRGSPGTGRGELGGQLCCCGQRQALAGRTGGPVRGGRGYARPGHRLTGGHASCAQSGSGTGRRRLPSVRSRGRSGGVRDRCRTGHRTGRRSGGRASTSGRRHLGGSAAVPRHPGGQSTGHQMLVRGPPHRAGRLLLSPP